ncbi:MFS transporter [Kitasatospora sp. MAP5-34]|uniref:MFS transporter n=1 Tax=Kitasatospora sp. MAP5-34 TaxID=3035102 RepID=UPI0024763F64|nr:MFS transporter [Kitasatospora sp. MAP5-34]MDH6575305.1 putative MFS family arabinose efflux permease [Kitasatospora sp. MAP5-34]
MLSRFQRARADQESPLRLRSFRMLLLGRSIASLSDGLMPVALSLAVIQLTDSAGTLAAVLSCAVGSRLVLLPLAGVLVDRCSLRWAGLAADLVRCAVQALVGVELLSRSPDMTTIAIAELFAGAASAVSLCSMSPLVAGVVERAEARQRANALMGVGRSLTLILGPLLAGLLVVAVGAGWVFLVDAAAFAVSGSTFLAIRVGRPAPSRRSLRADLVAGWGEVRSRDWFWSSLIAHASVTFADMVLVTLGPLVALGHPGGRAVWIAAVQAGGIGLLLGSLLAGRYRPSRPILVGNLVLAGCAVPQLMFAGWLPAPLIVAGYGVSWAAMGFLNPVWDSTVQAAVPAEQLAKVTSYEWLASLASQPLALLFAPLTAAAWGAGRAMAATAALVAVACLSTAAVPGVRRLRMVAGEVVGDSCQPVSAELTGLPQ